MGDADRGRVSSPESREGSAEPPVETGGASFWVTALIGAGIMVFGVRGLLGAAPATRPGEVAFSLVGLDLLHDAIVAPLVCVVGLLLTRWLPRWARSPIRAGLFASAVTVLVGWAALRGYGRAAVPDNPTVDPLDYASAVLTVIALVWGAVAVWVAVAWYRSRGAPPSTPGA
jgi:hypothetical protein